MAVAAALGVILTAGYILWMIQRVYLGPAREEYKHFPQASATEIAVLVPMAVLCVVMGVLPKHTVFNFMNGTLDLLQEQVVKAAGTLPDLAAAMGM
jgi:NADH-quinone oxidoreductase subunit M